MNRDHWTRSLHEHYAPPWPCPSCSKGTLAIVRKSLIYRETELSKREHGREDWFPGEADLAFTAWLKCGQCGQEVAVAGDGSFEQVEDGEGGVEWSAYFIPRYCYPMPNIFEIPRKCPKDVRDELRASFALSRADPAAAAGRLRVALELLTDSLGIQKRRKVKAGGFHDLTLHERLELLQRKEPVAGTQLMALKWLGNVGSHKGNVKYSDLLDAFEILEHSLVELVDHRTARVVALARELTMKHGPRRRR